LHLTGLVDNSNVDRGSRRQGKMPATPTPVGWCRREADGKLFVLQMRAMGELFTRHPQVVGRRKYGYGRHTPDISPNPP
jgi:hypothetical protein